MSSDVTTRTVVVDGVAVERVLEPSSVDELCDTLAMVGRDRLKALIASGGTRLAFGNPGGPFDLAISMRQLNRVIQYEPGDLTLAVEPGCTISEITRLLREHRQMFALDAAHPQRATIGGSYATGMSGPRRLSGGSLKDWVIGVEVAGVDGRIAKAGGMVVKNVTGFDMMHLHYGALGAFGVVTRLNLKVFPYPGATRTIRLTYSRPFEAHSAAVALLQSQLQPSSLAIANGDGWNLYVRYDAPDSAIERLIQRIVETASAATQPVEHEVSDDEDGALHPFRSVTDLINREAVARLPVPASMQADALTMLEHIGGQDVCADPGSGLIYVAGAPSREWIDAMGRIGGQPTYLKLPRELKQVTDVFGALAPPAAGVVRSLKDNFDPTRQLNPGRFVLGL